MTAVLDSLGDSGMAPAFVMIDPFGVAGVPYDIVRRLGEHPRTELLISFMYEGMSRFLGSQEFEEHLDELFGCPDWRGALSLSGASGRQYLHDLYEQRLKEAGYPLVRSFELLDDGNRTEYFLMFATKHPKGIEVMKDAMWKVDPDGTYRFSDATNPHQQTLFSSEPDYEQLARFVFENFAEQTANVTRIEEWTVINTAFRRAHLRKALRLLEERQQIVRVTGRQKRLTYPKGCQIQLARLD